MRSFAFVAAALMLAGVFAGCLGSSGDAPAKPASANLTNATSNVTIDTGESTNASGSMGQMAHMHDYWQSKERVTLMDADVSVPPQQAFMYTFVNVLRDHQPAVGGTAFRLPDGATVFEGTGRMEVTLTWTDPTIQGAALRVRTAASTAWSDAKPITSGSPLKIDVAPEMCDMPHEKTSRWGFQVVPAGAGSVIDGNLHVRVDIVRLRDISLFPGHPALFAGAHTMTLFDGPATSSHNGAATAIVDRLETQGQDPEEGVAAQKVVPMETQWMTANVTITDSTATLGTVNNISFLYKPADSNGFRRANVTHSDMAKGVFSFSWPVAMRQTDSPYAKTSQWRFDLLIQTSDPAGLGGSCGGCSDATVNYKLVVVAYDTAKPALGETPASG